MMTTALAPLNDIAAQLGFPLEAVGELLRMPGIQSILVVHGEKGREVADRRTQIDALEATIAANVREIQNQGLFAKAWASVSGHNKRLNKDSEVKTHEIHQASVLLTLAMVERNDASNQLIARLLAQTLARQVSVVREQNDVREDMTEVARAATANDTALRALRADHEALRADHEALRADHEALRINVQHVRENAAGGSPKKTTGAKPKSPRPTGGGASKSKVPKRTRGSR
jgi:hypothetical protein